jgi:hypothetical protein
VAGGIGGLAVRFFRPAVSRFLVKWSEPLIMAVVLFLGLWMYFRAHSAANATLLVVASIVIVAALALLFVAIRRVRLHTEKRGFGVVEVEERNITYYGPDTGGQVSLDDLVSIEVVTARAAGFVDVTYWQLTDRWGSVLIIPAGAEGSDAMVDSFAALPGLKYDLIITAMAAADDAVFTIWKKTG